MTQLEIQRLGDKLQGEFAQRSKAECGEDVTAGSALFAHDGIASAARQIRLLKRLKPRLVVEIGTGRAVTTVALARIAEKVITIDIGPLPLRTAVLDFAGAHNVAQVVVSADADKALLLHELDFDVAFIDGDHSVGGCGFDFEHVSKCGRVLFHDYTPETPNGPYHVVHKLPPDQVILDRPFAWWFAEGVAR